MKTIALLALTFLGVSTAFAAPGPAMSCPNGNQVVATVQNSGPNSYFVSPNAGMTAYILDPQTHSIAFKNATLQGGIMKCAYTSLPHGLLALNLNRDYANAQFIPSPLNASGSQKAGSYSVCPQAGVVAPTGSCSFLTKT